MDITHYTICTRPLTLSHSLIHSTQATAQQLRGLLESHPDGPPALDAQKELKINDLDFAEKASRRNILANRMTQSKCHACPKLDEQVRVRFAICVVCGCVYVCVHGSVYEG